MSQLIDFARHLASTLHQDYPADGVNKIRVSCHELTSHYTKAVNAAATLVALHFCPEESGVTRNRRERFDVVLRNNQGRIVGVGEWEYQRLMRSGRMSQNINEITKLKEICTSHPHQPQFAFYIGYVTEQQVQAASMLVNALWAGTPAPLLLVLIHFYMKPVPGRKSVRRFTRMSMHQVMADRPPFLLCEMPALPWEVQRDDDVRWLAPPTGGMTVASPQ